MGVIWAFIWVLYTNLYVSYMGAVMGLHISVGLYMGVMWAFIWVLYTNLHVSYMGAVMGLHICVWYMGVFMGRNVPSFIHST